MQIQALYRQSLFDLSIQTYGSVAYVFDLALANGLSITSVLEPGQHIEAPEIEVESTDIQNYYQSHGIKPATAIETELLETEDDCNYCKLFE
ncbi:hypothetical protein ML462_14100 [Gramella lutea]|uniref:Uncharacterized protein n=1 Tax=Christiangramia lutea TaxID=1607951 RepID=A0A9X2AA40_9FLAO|nr:hypothetical protein [Christiangramia lutea]MCH4824304.1 hypothetical protein [Christiangramia lutea]